MCGWLEGFFLNIYLVHSCRKSLLHFIVSVLYNLCALPDCTEWLKTWLRFASEGILGETSFLFSVFFLVLQSPRSTTTMFSLFPLQLNHWKCTLCPVQASLCLQTSQKSFTGIAAEQLEDIKMELLLGKKKLK